MKTDLERFLDCMEYRASDRRPNHELAVWGQTIEAWRDEAPDAVADFTWDWFTGEAGLGMDRREFIPVNYSFIPAYQPEVQEEDDRYVVARNSNGIVTRALKEGTAFGTRLSMDEYIDFPVHAPEDFADIKRRLVAALPERLPVDMPAQVERWQKREHPLIAGLNCAANGFYWRAREWMGTTALSYAWYDYPDLMHEMMEFYADFIIETSRPVLERTTLEYFCLNEDLSMKTGPLLSPASFRKFIFPHLKRMVEFFKGHGTRYFAIDTDGDPTALVPMFMDAGVDVLWPIERASNVCPNELRRRFGKGLRLWGGVDKRELAKDRDAIRAHLREFIPLIEEGGFIPTVDHAVPPDISWDNFRYYNDLKAALLSSDFGKLD
jgi:uroporphyrinogen decarboxylase